MTVLVFGHSGKVATELRRQGDVVALNRDEADLAMPQRCAAIIAEIGPDVVINAAAYTGVDAAETDEALATLINGEAPTAMAVAAAALQIPFLHISTDYVFDGSPGRAWRPEDAASPIGAYGRSKLAGELGVRRAGGQHVILRTAWVFSAHGSNFVKTMLRLADTRDRLSVVADQTGGPTAAADIAAALLTISSAFRAGNGASGTYHFAGAPATSWANFARAIFVAAGKATEVDDIAASDYPTPARRPENSVLDCTTLKDDFGIAQPDWRDGLEKVLREL